MSASLARSLISNWLGLFIAGVAGLILSPILVRSLGKDLYGSWTLIVSLTAQLAILDFGVRNSIVAFVSRARARKDTQELSTTLSTALGLLTILGACAFVLVSLAVPFVGVIFSLDPDLIYLFQILLLIYAFDGALELIFGVFNGALAGSERYDVINTITSLRIAINAILVVVGLQHGFGVMGVATIALVTRFLQRLGFAFFTHQLNRGVRIEYRLWSSHIAREITRYGAWAFLIVLAGRIIYQTDLVITGMFLGPSSVTVYAIALLLIDQLRMLTQTANTILTPRLSSLEARGQFDEQKKIIEKWSFLSTALVVAVGIPLLLNGSAFIFLWMGPGFEESATILSLLVVPFFLTAPSLSLSSYLYATSQHSSGARVQITEAILNLVTSIILVTQFGLLGVALGTVIPAILCSGLILPWLTCKKLRLPFLQFVAKTSGRAAIPALLYAATLLGAKKVFGVETWIGFLSSNSIPALLFTLLIFFFYLDTPDRQYLKRRFLGG